MRLFVFTIISVMLLAFVASTRPTSESSSIIAVFKPGLQKDDLIALGQQEGFQIIRFLGLSGLALVRPGTSLKTFKKQSSVLWVMDAKGLMGCDGTKQKQS